MRGFFVTAALVGLIAANYFVDEHVAVSSLNGDSTFERIYNSVAAAKAAGKPVHVSDAVVAKLSSAESAEDIYHAVVTLSLLEKTGDAAGRTDALLGFVGQPFENAGYALEAIATIGAAGGVSEEQKSSLVAKVAKLLRAAHISHDEVSASFGDVATTGRIITALGSLSASLHVPFPVGKAESSQFATYLSEAAGADAEDKHYADAALRYFASNDQHRPLLFRVRNDAVVLGGDGTIVVSVTDAAGNAGPALKVFASKITTDDHPDTAVRRDIELSKVSDTEYSFNLLTDEITRGFYIIDFAVEILEENSKYINVEDVSELVKVTAPVELSECQLSVSDSREEADTTASRAHSCSTERSSGTINADHSQNIHLSFKISSHGKPAKPHQVFLRLAHQRTHEDAIFVAKASESGRHSLHANLAEVADIFEHESGNYVATVLVGDALLPQAISWEVATFNLKLGEAPASDVVDPYQIRPEIHHKFRDPEKRAPEVVSLVFTALTAAPLLFLIIALGRLGVNISDFPSGTAGLYATGFHAAIVGIAALYVCYWLKLTMFTTLGYLGVLGVVAFFTGQKFLSWKAHQRSHTKTD